MFTWTSALLASPVVLQDFAVVLVMCSVHDSLELTQLNCTCYGGHRRAIGLTCYSGRGWDCVW